ncbi:MAG: SpoIIE family protein phosphatase [Fusobacteriota bacterium]
MKINFLKESNDFLNKLLENINSAVFLVDNSIKIQEFNDFTKILFQKKEEEFLNKLCGNGLGCANQKKYNMDCGTTPACNDCDLRNDIIKVFKQKVSIEKKLLEREFIISKNKKRKYLEYSIKPIKYNENFMAVIIMHDLTEREIQKRQIEELNNEINRELDIAQKIQKTLMPPRNYKNRDIEIDIYYKPFMKISGDFYDIIELSENKILVFLSDITGHGIPASLYTSMLKKELDDILEENITAAKILDNLNNYLNKNLPDGYYFPTLVAIIDVDKNTINYSNSGADEPIMVTNNKVQILKGKDPVLGLIPETCFTERKIKYKNNDELYIFTDGIITIESNETIKQIPKKYLYNFFEKNNSDKIKDKIRNYAEYILNYEENSKWGDDITIIGIKLK